MKIAADKEDIIWALKTLNGRMRAIHGDTLDEDGVTFDTDKETDHAINGDLYDLTTGDALIKSEVADWVSLLKQANEVDDDGDVVPDFEKQLRLLCGMYSQAMAMGILMERHRATTNSKMEASVAEAMATHPDAQVEVCADCSFPLTSGRCLCG